MSFALMFLLLFFSGPQNPSSQPSQARAASSATTVDPEIAEKFLKVKRIYVDSFGDDSVSKQLQAMVINALTESKRFIITENKDKADAILRGTGLEKTSQELHATSEGTAVGAAAAGHTGSINGTFVNGNGSISGSSSGGAVARNMAVHDAQASTETVNDARLAVRLVVSDGDVVWATTKESHGAKYEGASADAADQVVKQLLWDLEELEKARPQDVNKKPNGTE